jgi:hypothetical protein
VAGNRQAGIFEKKACRLPLFHIDLPCFCSSPSLFPIYEPEPFDAVVRSVIPTFA